MTRAQRHRLAIITASCTALWGFDGPLAVDELISNEAAALRKWRGQDEAPPEPEEAAN